MINLIPSSPFIKVETFKKEILLQLIYNMKNLQKGYYDTNSDFFTKYNIMKVPMYLFQLI